MVPTSNGHRRRLPTKQHKTIEIPPNPGGTQRPCRDAGVGAIAPGFAMLKKASALHTLIHQRHLTPLCGGHAPTAERTLNPARTRLESLDRRPGIREQPGSRTALKPCGSRSAYFDHLDDALPYSTNTTLARRFDLHEQSAPCHPKWMDRFRSQLDSISWSVTSTERGEISSSANPGNSGADTVSICISST
jgi:hypothetical protein